MSKKGLLQVLMVGQADTKPDSTTEEKQRANRLSNSALYGHLLDTMEESAPDLAAELQDSFVDGNGFADGYEAVRYLKARVLVDSYHRNDVLEAKINRLLLERVPSGCSPDVWRGKLKELRELNSELISGKREGEALSSA